LLPHSGRIAKAQRIAGTKSQENEFLKNSQTGLCRSAQAEPQSLQFSGFQGRDLEPVGGDRREVSRLVFFCPDFSNTNLH